MLVDFSEVLPGLTGSSLTNNATPGLSTYAGGTVPERRARHRITVHWPILFFRMGSGETIETVTQNLSSNGFYCHAAVPITPGEAVRCILKIPSYDPTGFEKSRVLECRIRVTRVEPGSVEGSFGIACQIQDFQLIVGEDRREQAGQNH
jgi:PilZ domain